MTGRRPRRDRSGHGVRRTAAWPVVMALLTGVPVASAQPTASAPAGNVRSTISGPALEEACQSRRSEMWPQLVVDPHDARRLTATFMSEGMLAAGAATSTDGGRSWTRGAVTATARCRPGAGFDYMVNPQLAAGPDGTAYFGNSWVVRPSDPVFRYGTLVHAASESQHGWSSGTSPGGDEWTHNIGIVPDPDRPGHAVALWTRIVQIPLPALTPGFIGPTSELLAATTEDGGRTFSGPVRVAFHPGEILVNVQGRRASDGAVLAAYDRVPLVNPLDLVARDETPWTQVSVRSVDGGRTWDEPVTVGERDLVFHADPDGRAWGNEQHGVPVGSFKFDLATGPDGRAALVWAAAAGEGRTTIRMARSSDGGRTWSPPENVATRRNAIQPAVAFDRRGEMAVLFYDWSNDVIGDEPLTTDVWLARDGGTGTWSVRHLDGPFDLRAAYEDGVVYDGWAVGVYQDLVGLEQGFGAAYTVAAPLAQDGATDVRFVAVVARKPLPSAAEL